MDWSRLRASVASSRRLWRSSGSTVRLFPADELEQRPLLMVVSAWVCMARGEPGRALQWVARASAALPERHPTDVHGHSPPVALAMARMAITPLSPAEMTREAMYVYRQ